jgi:hypothetical protein
MSLFGIQQASRLLPLFQLSLSPCVRKLGRLACDIAGKPWSERPRELVPSATAQEGRAVGR